MKDVELAAIDDQDQIRVYTDLDTNEKDEQTLI
jgi:hypothetical protein